MSAIVASLQSQLNAYVRRVRLSALSDTLKAHYIYTYTQNIIKMVARFRAPVKSALLVGINYRGSPYQLDGCINDVTNMRDYLQGKRGFNNAVMLTDDATLKPTKQNILNEFTKMLQNAIVGDVVLFGFSGHGTETVDFSRDEVDGMDEVLVPIDATSIQSCIIDDELRRIINLNLKPGVMLYALLDCCFSGTAFDLKYSYMARPNPFVGDTPSQVYMISGCADRNVSIEGIVNGKPAGAMTTAFLECTKSGTPTLKQLIDRMRGWLNTNQVPQQPQLSCGTMPNFTREFFI